MKNIMKLLILFTLIFISFSYACENIGKCIDIYYNGLRKNCFPDWNVDGCVDEAIKQKTPLAQSNYNNLLEFTKNCKCGGGGEHIQMFPQVKKAFEAALARERVKQDSIREETKKIKLNAENEVALAREREQAKQDSIRVETEKRKQAIQDSIKREAEKGKQAIQDSIKREAEKGKLHTEKCPEYLLQSECYKAFGIFSDCNYSLNTGYLLTEEGFRCCSVLVDRCDGYINEEIERMKKTEKILGYRDGTPWPINLRDKLQEIAKIKQEEIILKEEILALIKDNAEISLILGKCKEYRQKSTPLQECEDIQDSIKITKVTALLKVNKLEESIEECNEGLYGKCFRECEIRRPLDATQICVNQCNIHRNEKIIDLCETQLATKIKKLPKNKIKTVKLAKIYYGGDYEVIRGYIIQNDGKMLLIEDTRFGYTIMIQHTGHIEECRLNPSMQMPFTGYVKRIGDKTYTTVLGVRQSVPNYQLLWCN